MPVIQFPGYTKDPFGGPAGGTQQMFAAMLSSYMKTQEEQKKREQEKLLAELLGGGGTPEQPPGADPTGPAMNMSAPQGGYPMEGPQDYQSRAQAVMSNPALDIRQKIQGLGLLNAQKELEPTTTRVRQTKIEWWDKDGKPHVHYAAEGTENAVVKDLESRGATVGKVEKPDIPNDKIIQLKEYQKRFPEGSLEWNIAAKGIADEEALRAANLAAKNREGKGDGSNTPEDLKKKGRVQVGDSWYSPAELRGFWKDEYKLIDQDDPAYWQLTPEQQRSMDERVQQAPKLSDFVNQARRQGYMPGTDPLTSTPGEINKEAAATPIDDEAVKLERMTPPAGGTPPPPPPAKVKDPDKFKQLMSTPEGQALRQAGWPGDRPPTAAEIAKAKAALQSKQVRK